MGIQSVIPSVSRIFATDMTRTIASWSGAAKWSKKSVLGSNDDDEDEYCYYYCPFGSAIFCVDLSYTAAFHIMYTYIFLTMNWLTDTWHDLHK